MKAKVHTKENVTYVLRDKDGNIKKLFQENALWRFILKYFHIRAPQIPLLFGMPVSQKQFANLVTTVGKALVAGRINGSGSPAAATYIAIGTGTTAANVADTTLETEITTGGGERAAGTVSLVTTDTTNDTARVTYTFTFTSSFAITEAGLLNAASSGTLLARQVFSAINVISGDTLAITWNLDID